MFAGSTSIFVEVENTVHLSHGIPGAVVLIH